MEEKFEYTVTVGCSCRTLLNRKSGQIEQAPHGLEQILLIRIMSVFNLTSLNQGGKNGFTGMP